MEDLYARVSALRSDAFALIDDLRCALGEGATERDDDLATTLASLQGVANRLGHTEATLAPRAAGPAG